MRRKSAGYSLIEISIGLLITTVVFAGFTLTVTRLYDNAFEHNQLSILEADANRIAFYLRYSFRQATSVQYFNGDINNYTTANGVGVVRPFTSSQLSGDNRRATAVAVFLQESGGVIPTEDRSRYDALGLIFQHPSPTTSGVLYFSKRTAAGAQVNIRPNFGDLYFDNLVEFETSFTEVLSNGMPVSLVRVRYVLRRFNQPNQTEWRWCPAGASTTFACRPGVLFDDLERVIDIPLKNNPKFIDASGSALVTSAFGRLYFFRFLRPGGSGWL